MSSITRFVLNLSIGAKLGIASGLGVLLVAAMVTVQIRANTALREADMRKSAQQTIARDAAEAKASIRGMQIGVRDLRLANNPAGLQAANDYLAARLKSVNHFADDMIKLSSSTDDRVRVEKLKTRAAEYAKAAQQIAAVRGEAIAAAGGADAAARIAKLNEEAIRIAREVTLPIAAELESLANQATDSAKRSVDQEAAQAAREMAAVEWQSMAMSLCTILLLIGTSSSLSSRSPVRCVH